MMDKEQQRNGRRDFIKKAAAGTAGMAVGGSALSMPASSYGRILGANDRVRVGIVGFSNRARGALIPAMLEHSEELNFDIVAVSDIWNRRREKGAAMIGKEAGRKVRPMRNNEELYEKGDVDAVIISTADFQHARHAIQAVEAGKDVYVEKPFAHFMDDARDAREVVENSDRVLQVGTQRRSARNYQMANDFIKSRKFGDIVSVDMTWNVNQPGRWRRPELTALIEKEDTDWERYLMHLPDAEWDPRKYLEYRLFWPYSSGIPDQWMVHQIDTVHWFTGLPHPRSVVANGGVYKWNDGRENWDTLTAVYDYGPLGKDPEETPTEGFQVVYSSRQTNSAGGVKEIYYSNGGTLDLESNTISPEGGLEEGHAEDMNMEPNLLPETEIEATAVQTSADTTGGGATSSHMRNFMESVRERKEPNAPIRAAYDHSVALAMTIKAMHTGKRVTFDEEKQEVVTG